MRYPPIPIPTDHARLLRLENDDGLALSCRIKLMIHPKGVIGVSSHATFEEWDDSDGGDGGLIADEIVFGPDCPTVTTKLCALAHEEGNLYAHILILDYVGAKNKLKPIKRLDGGKPPRCCQALIVIDRDGKKGTLFALDYENAREAEDKGWEIIAQATGDTWQTIDRTLQKRALDEGFLFSATEFGRLRFPPWGEDQGPGPRLRPLRRLMPEEQAAFERPHRRVGAFEPLGSNEEE